ncbi:General transcription factor IIF subunit 1 like protein [Argiope bruennichi]|uniref:Transcription initiation factor IIF subunit alpha n=1 Tax=Argiope bruennichi TaxID=94029 RepID=A0A8T0EQS9_ARGBR|nr:General transcription factor IIF subunit 1 like protein [Argiope bruennichi]
MSASQNSNDASKSNAAAASSPQVVQEYIVKMPKNKSKCFNVMRFSHSLNVDVTKWTQAKMERENNLKEFKADEDLPKYGAGSEFGREQREEARRKKYGIVSKKYNSEDQPWLLKLNGKAGKKYKGIREGGVTENASYYVFTQASDGTFEAYPVAEWYNFTPIQRYKALNAEEAEEEFSRRDKVMNYFSIMVKKRLQKENAEEEEVEGEKTTSKKNKKSAKDFKISDMDDWAKDSDDSEGDEEEDEEESSSKKNAKKGKGKDKKKQKKDVDEEAKEESDEGDFDDREVDYITGSSSSEDELPEDEKIVNELKGVEDEEALRKLDASEDEEEEEEENKETEENTEQEKAPEVQKTKKKKEGKGGDSSGDSSSDTSDSDFDDTKVHAKQAKKNGSDNSASSSRANTPTRLNADGKDGGKGTKRKLGDVSVAAAKKAKTDGNAGSTTFVNSLDGITEEAIRRYLSRKPMTASELLHKFKSKKTKLSSDQLVTKIADVLKRMDLVKRNIKGKMYLSLKT